MSRQRPVLGVKMCGSCNPYIRPVRLAGRIAELLDADIVPYSREGISVTINACDAACAAAAYPATAMICALSVNQIACRNEQELAERAAAVLKPFLYDSKEE